MSKYRNGEAEPETLRQMHAMMAQPKPAPHIADPTSIAIECVFRIYMELKNKVLLGDKQPDSIAAALREARERTVREVVLIRLRENAVAKYDKMLAVLEGGGAIQL